MLTLKADPQETAHDETLAQLQKALLEMAKKQSPRPKPAYRYVVLDIETTYPADEHIARAAQAWSAPSNWKPETVERKRQEALERIRDKSALLDAAPIISVSVCTNEDRYLFHTLLGVDTRRYSGWTFYPCADEGELLAALHVLDRRISRQVILAGHGVRRFDLPKLRNAYARHAMPMPGFLRVPWDESDRRVYDTERMIRYFSAEKNDGSPVSFEETQRVLGLDSHKQVMHGAEVPAAYVAGRHQAIMLYSMLDGVAEEAVFLRMWGAGR